MSNRAERLWNGALCSLLIPQGVAAMLSNLAASGNLDQFNYGETVGTDYGLSDWNNVQCTDLDQCMGWPDKWNAGIEWGLEFNSCRWCPADDPLTDCGTHHQSPINLERNRAIVTDPMYNKCIDKHWMAYHDSSCLFEDLVKYNAFSIERHALKIAQPLQYMGNDTYQVACHGSGRGPRFGRIDFSKGFSQWWHLSHIDVHVPSEHTQEGKRYDGEIQMYHFYSVSGEVAGINNQAYNDTTDWDVLNRIICQWRAAEERTRQQCGLASVDSEYPGCLFYRRGHGSILESSNASTDSSRAGSSNVRTRGLSRTRPEQKNTVTSLPAKSLSAHDLLMANFQSSRNNLSYEPKKINLAPEDYAEADPDFDWDAFITAEYAEQTKKSARKLLNYEHVGPWFNYFPMLAVRTEYYFRYSGTQTIPPCYGPYVSGSKNAWTNNWRVMKDPIRVSHRQIDELNRLLRKRIAPPNDPIRPCQPDTAGKIDPKNPKRISVARPVQTFNKAHYEVFCECQNWKSKWLEDQSWCRIRNQSARYFDHPYNFESVGF